MASPPPPPPPPPTRRTLPPPCWSHDETLALIESYRHKWHSLRCANLRAAHWDEVASDLSRRTSLLPSSSPKTSVQCRHKIEKLRKRFRSDRLRSLSLRPHTPPNSSWPFFPFMQSLDYPPNENEGVRFVIPRRMKSRSGKEKGEEREEGMVDALRRVGDGFMRMEKVKMEMARETERMRREMELKRTRMILDSQQQLVDAFVKGFVGEVKKRKKGRFSDE